MPSFDIVSEVDLHEVANAVDQANREVGTRFDFKGTGAKFELDQSDITLQAEVEFQLSQMLDVLKIKLAKRSVDIACLDISDPELANQRASQRVKIQQGLDSDLARKIVKIIKAAKLKVQCAVQGDQVRISGKKRDDLQKVIALMRDQDLELPLQYQNFRD